MFQLLPDRDRFKIVSRISGDGTRFQYDYRDGLLRTLRRNGDLTIMIERNELAGSRRLKTTWDARSHIRMMPTDDFKPLETLPAICGPTNTTSRGG